MVESPTHVAVSEACTRAAAAFGALSSLAPESRAALLDSIAAALDARREEILKTCAGETALTIDELTPEFARMTGTLRMFAAVVRDGSWVRAAIDTPVIQSPRGYARAAGGSSAQPAHNPSGPAVTAGALNQLIGPNHDLRKLLIPLGPVAVFGSSNFPLAYGVCGGDTASALAAACPVIIKEHPAHPRTGRLLAAIAQRALNEPRASASGPTTPAVPTLLQYIHNNDPKDFSPAQQLVRNDHIAAVGFTGSVPGGLAIEKIAHERTYPIPVFAEMGSMNLIIVLGHALRARPEQIADELATSLLARHGQQCTAPGMILVAGYENADWMFQALKERIQRSTPRKMLAPWIAESYRRRVAEVLETEIVEQQASQSLTGITDSRVVAATILYTQATKLENRSAEAAWDEIFGPAVILAGADRLAPGYFSGDGRLTATLIADPADFEDSPMDLVDEAFIDPGTDILDYVRQFAGRIIFNGVPTGVRVATSMVHGGPFPATNRPDTTAVGPPAIERWCRPVCYQNCPDALLPPELQNANPRGIWRTVNGLPTKSAVT